MKKLLVTGASGLLGASIVYELNKYFKIYATYNQHKIISGFAEYFKTDLIKEDDVFSLIKKIKPDVIVHTAALTDVDLCEENKKLAYDVNVKATKNIAKMYKHKFIYISTSYIFDGKKGDYSEIDKTNPVNEYGKTKLEGEKIVKECNDFLIIRTNIYGWNIQKKQSFVEWVISNLNDKRETHALTDQKTSMIFVNDLAKILKQMLDKDLRGVYNVASHNSLTKYEVAFKIADIFGLDKNLIKPTTTEKLMKRVIWKVIRPKNTSLDVSKIEKLIKMPSFHESLTHMRRLESTYKKQFVYYD